MREGHDFGLMPDALFTTALYEGNGGLALRDAAGTAVDQVGWGAEAPAGYVAGSPIMPEISGGSLERLPGGDAGNGLTTGSNDTDFMLTAAPNPQNSGSDPTPLPEQRLAIRLAGPKAVAPLEEFETLIIVENLTGEEAAEVHVSIPVSPDYTVVALPEGAVVENGRFQFTIPQLPAGGRPRKPLHLASAALLQRYSRLRLLRRGGRRPGGLWHALLAAGAGWNLAHQRGPRPGRECGHGRRHRHHVYWRLFCGQQYQVLCRR
ncbi:MAG: hypothetical protein M5U34_09625 [Chloroflexi bacterium]|nr:hypothetical protein [Chloroflexota bacterium]